jgi:hypothetical protein
MVAEPKLIVTDAMPVFALLRRERRLVGRLGFAPSSHRLRAGTSLSKFATLVNSRREGGVEPPQSGL